MLGYGCGSGRTGLFSHELVRWRFFLLLAGTVLIILFGQAGSAFANLFFNTGSMGSARQDYTATLLNDGSVLVAGGLSTASVILGSAEIYNPSSGTFSATTGAMNIHRQYHTATRLAEGRVLITGGISSSGGAPLASAEIYQHATGTFTVTGPMNSIRRNHTATLLNSGKVLIAGGRNGSFSSSTLNTAELFDSAANGGAGAFNYTNKTMTLGRGYHTASLLTDYGTVLITGGLTASGASTNTAEIYDPGADRFTATGNMNVARNYHTAVVLQDVTHRVLIAGGATGSVSASLASAEIYDPSLGAFGSGTIAMN